MRRQSAEVRHSTASFITAKGEEQKKDLDTNQKSEPTTKR